MSLAWILWCVNAQTLQSPRLGSHTPAIKVKSQGHYDISIISVIRSGKTTALEVKWFKCPTQSTDLMILLIFPQSIKQSK